MEIHGSRNRGDAREDSDLDVVVEYEGDFKEDALFNMLNEEPLEIEGITVDINPIRKEETGTLDKYMERSREYDEEQKAEAESQAETTSNGYWYGTIDDAPETPTLSKVCLRRRNRSEQAKMKKRPKQNGRT
jgi:predicted nucleotidyltransferase